MPDPVDKPLKILIIDDEPVWCTTIGTYAEILGHIWKSAGSLEETKAAITKAEEAGTPFSVATIDMRFAVGPKGTESQLGTGILWHIKSKHPYIACIMVTSSPEVAHQLLELRDEYQLDSYISKDDVNPKTLTEAIAKAIGRVRSPEKGDEPVQADSLRRQLTEARANLRLIEERASEYVLTTSVPLQLVKERQRLEERIAELEAELADA